jgi:hypothetical protein
MRPISAIFLRTIDGMEQSIGLLSELRSLGVTPSSRTVERFRLGKAAVSTQALLRRSREWETMALDGSILLLASQFEMTVRDMAETFVTAIGRKFRLYKDLPEGLRNSNLRLIGQLLQDTTRAQVAHVDSNIVVQDLAACLRRGRPFGSSRLDSRCMKEICQASRSQISSGGRQSPICGGA